MVLKIIHHPNSFLASNDTTYFEKNDIWDNRYVIEKLFVAPEYQNNHIAQNLLHAVINNFTDLPISMAVFKENRIMAHILIKYGFRQSYNRSLSLEYGKNKIDIFNEIYINDLCKFLSSSSDLLSKVRGANSIKS